MKNSSNSLPCFKKPLDKAAGKHLFENHMHAAGLKWQEVY
jgi:hypothetical protein